MRHFFHQSHLNLLEETRNFNDEIQEILKNLMTRELTEKELRTCNQFLASDYRNKKEEMSDTAFEEWFMKRLILFLKVKRMI